MATILAFAGSNSSTSINFQLVKATASAFDQHNVQLLNMANTPFPMYSEDNEEENGFSNTLVEFRDDIKKADALILSVNEHNGNPSAYFKNVLDWLSRLDRNFLEGTLVLLMSTSPGKRGAAASLGIIENTLPRFGAEITATFSLPSFNQNFDSEKGITDAGLKEKHLQAIAALKSAIA